MSGPIRVLVEDLPRSRRDPVGDPGPFGVPPSGGKDQSDPRKRGTPNECVRNKANCPAKTGMDESRAGQEGPLHRCPLCKTKPIAASGPGWARAGRTGTGPPPLRIVRNKANCLRAKWKTSALWKKSYGQLDAIKASAKQSQFPPGQPWAGPTRLPPLETSVRNKANFRGQAGTMDLEQTLASPARQSVAVWRPHLRLVRT